MIWQHQLSTSDKEIHILNITTNIHFKVEKNMDGWSLSLHNNTMLNTPLFHFFGRFSTFEIAQQNASFLLKLFGIEIDDDQESECCGNCNIC